MFVKTELSELRAENEQLKAEWEWLPIETAPKDGTNILGLIIGEGAIQQISWDEDRFQWLYDNGRDFLPCRYQPTHWMNLPLLPDGNS